MRSAAQAQLGYYYDMYNCKFKFKVQIQVLSLSIIY